MNAAATWYLWVSFGTMILGIVMRLVCLTFLDYPRNSVIDRGVDATVVGINIGIAYWALVALGVA